MTRRRMHDDFLTKCTPSQGLKHTFHVLRGATQFFIQAGTGSTSSFKCSSMSDIAEHSESHSLPGSTSLILVSVLEELFLWPSLFPHWWPLCLKDDLWRWSLVGSLPSMIVVSSVLPMTLVGTHLLTIPFLPIIIGVPPEGVNNFSCATRSVKSLVKGSMTLSVVPS